MIVDLFSGTGSATEPFEEDGHEVVRLDLIDRGNQELVADVRKLPLRNESMKDLTLLWASVPCTEYSLARGRHGLIKHPDNTLYYSALEAVRMLRPKYWIIENVQGAQRFFGTAPFHWGAWYLWGRFPPLKVKGIPPRKEYYEWKDVKSIRAVLKAMIPRPLAQAVHEAVCSADKSPHPR